MSATIATTAMPKIQNSKFRTARLYGVLGGFPLPQINQAGLDLIKSFEGCRLKAYQDPVGVWTIGYGHTENVYPGQQITPVLAEKFLAADLRNFEQGVNDAVSHDINPNQFAALVSFAYNLGLGALHESTLLHDVNAGDYAAAEAEFGRWVYADGVELPGLVLRREAEAKLFATPC